MKKEIVRQSNKLLETPLFKSAVQLKIFFKIIIAIQQSPNDEIYWLPAKQLLSDINSNEKNYLALKEIAEKMKKIDDINLQLDDGEVISTLFPNIFIKKAGKIGFQVNNLLKPFILELSKGMYTQFYFQNVSRLKSSYSIRLYELLKQYEKIGSRKFTVEKLRYLLLIDEGKYTRYHDFKKKVIFPPYKELLDKTDIYFEFEEIKKGRSVVEIKFSIFRNKKNTEIIENEIVNDTSNSIENKLTKEQKDLQVKLIDEYKISKGVTNNIIQSVNVEQIERNIIYSKNEYKQGKVNKNLSGYLINAIKNDYADKISSFEKEETSRKVEAKKKIDFDENKKNLREKLSKQFSKEKKEEFINSLNDEAKKKIIQEILEELKTDKYASSHVEKKGLSSPSASMGIINRIDGFEDKKAAYIKEKMKEAGF